MQKFVRYRAVQNVLVIHVGKWVGPFIPIPHLNKELDMVTFKHIIQNHSTIISLFPTRPTPVQVHQMIRLYLGVIITD